MTSKIRNLIIGFTATVFSLLTMNCTAIGYAVGHARDTSTDRMHSIPIHDASVGKTVYITLRNFEKIIGEVIKVSHEEGILIVLSKDGKEEVRIKIKDIENIDTKFSPISGRVKGSIIGASLDIISIAVTSIIITAYLGLIFSRGQE